MLRNAPCDVTVDYAKTCIVIPSGRYYLGANQINLHAFLCFILISNVRCLDTFDQQLKRYRPECEMSDPHEKIHLSVYSSVNNIRNEIPKRTVG